MDLEKYTKHPESDEGALTSSHSVVKRMRKLAVGECAWFGLTQESAKKPDSHVAKIVSALKPHVEQFIERVRKVHLNIEGVLVVRGIPLDFSEAAESGTDLTVQSTNDTDDEVSSPVAAEKDRCPIDFANGAPMILHPVQNIGAAVGGRLVVRQALREIDLYDPRLIRDTLEFEARGVPRGDRFPMPREGIAAASRRESSRASPFGINFKGVP